MKNRVSACIAISAALSCAIGAFTIVDRFDSIYEKAASHDSDMLKIRRELLNSKLEILEGRIVRMETSFKDIPIDQIPSPEARLYAQSIDEIERIKDVLTEIDSFE